MAACVKYPTGNSAFDNRFFFWNLVQHVSVFVHSFNTLKIPVHRSETRDKTVNCLSLLQALFLSLCHLNWKFHKNPNIQNPWPRLGLIVDSFYLTDYRLTVSGIGSSHEEFQVVFKLAIERNQRTGTFLASDGEQRTSLHTMPYIAVDKQVFDSIGPFLCRQAQYPSLNLSHTQMVLEKVHLLFYFPCLRRSLSLSFGLFSPEF